MLRNRERALTPSPSVVFTFGLVVESIKEFRGASIIGKFPRCSCVYFVTMLIASLGGHGAYVQCKHVYHILYMIIFCELTKEFIHYYMWSWDEV